PTRVLSAACCALSIGVGLHCKTNDPVLRLARRFSSCDGAHCANPAGSETVRLSIASAAPAAAKAAPERYQATPLASSAEGTRVPSVARLSRPTQFEVASSASFYHRVFRWNAKSFRPRQGEIDRHRLTRPRKSRMLLGSVQARPRRGRAPSRDLRVWLNP